MQSSGYIKKENAAYTRYAYAALFIVTFIFCALLTGDTERSLIGTLMLSTAVLLVIAAAFAVVLVVWTLRRIIRGY